jgi:polysaccharide biosynthesis transport protein
MYSRREDDLRKPYDVMRYEQRDLPVYLEDLDYRIEEEIHLRDYLNVILKRRWIVLIFLISVVVTTMIFTSMVTPLYKSTTVVRINKESPNVLSFRGIDMSDSEQETLQEIFKSRNLAERVISKLSLDKDPNFMPVESKLSEIKSVVYENTIGAIANLYSSLAPKSPTKGEHGSYQAPVEGKVPIHYVNSLISRLEVTPVKKTELVEVSFVSHNPELSFNVTNEVAQAFLAFSLESRANMSKEAKDFIQRQIESMREKLGASEKKLNDFASMHGIIMDNNKESLLTRKLSDISAALNSVTNERLQKEALYREVKESGANSPVILSNPLILELKNNFNKLEAEYSNLLTTFTPDYPKMKSLRSQMDTIQRRLGQEISKIIGSVESDYKASLKKEENLSKALKSQKGEVLSFQDAIAQFEALKRDVEVNKGLYNSLLQRLNEVDIAANSKESNIQIIDKAVYPKTPYKPDVHRNILLSIFFGLFGGVGLAFLVEYFDNNIKGTDDIERKIHLPALGMIPIVGDMGVRSTLPLKMIQLQKESSSSTLPMIVHPENTSPVSEAFRSMGAFLLLSSPSKPPRTILVTGPGERIGKTTICINIAKALLESMGKGILIDADLRRPKLHHVLKVNNSVGLSTFLSGNIEFDGSDGELIKTTAMKGLSIITAGPPSPNPSELVGSTRMQDLIYALQLVFEFIIIDSAPVMGIPDALYLSRIVDGTVLVVKSGETPRKALIETKRLFRSINAKILGVVLNGVSKDELKYGSYNYYHSSYYTSYYTSSHRH